MRRGNADIDGNVIMPVLSGGGSGRHRSGGWGMVKAIVMAVWAAIIGWAMTPKGTFRRRKDGKKEACHHTAADCEFCRESHGCDFCVK